MADLAVVAGSRISASGATGPVPVEGPEPRGDRIVGETADEPFDVRVGHPAIFATDQASFDIDRAASRTHHPAAFHGQRSLGRFRAFRVDKTCTHGRLLAPIVPFGTRPNTGHESPTPRAARPVEAGGRTCADPTECGRPNGTGPTVASEQTMGARTQAARTPCRSPRRRSWRRRRASPKPPADSLRGVSSPTPTYPIGRDQRP